MKKYLSFALVIAMVLSFSGITAFAAGSARLKSVDIPGGVIVPGFKPGTEDYTVAIDEEGEIPDISYVAENASASIEITKAPELNEATTIKVTCGAEEKTYRFTFVGKSERGADGLVTINSKEDLAIIRHFEPNGSDRDLPDDRETRNVYAFVDIHGANTQRYNFALIRFDFSEVTNYDIFGKFDLTVYEVYNMYDTTKNVRMMVYAVNTDAFSDWGMSDATFNNTFGNGNMYIEDEYVSYFVKDVNAGTRAIDISEVIRPQLLKGNKVITIMVAVDPDQTFNSTSKLTPFSMYAPPKIPESGKRNWPRIAYNTVVKSTNANLKSLDVKNGILEPPFDPAVTEYKIAATGNELPQISYKAGSSKASVDYTPANKTGDTAIIKVTPESEAALPKEYKFEYTDLAGIGITENGTVKISSLGYIKGDETVVSLTANSGIFLKAELRNENTSPREINFFNVIKKNGALQSVSASSETVDMNYGTAESGTLNIPADITGVTAEGYVFDEEMNPLCEKISVPAVSQTPQILSADADISYKFDGEKVILFGKAEAGQIIPLFIAKPQKIINDFKNIDKNDLAGIDVVKANSDGIWESEIVLSGEKGIYTAYIQCRGQVSETSFLYSSLQDKLNILSNVYDAIFTSQGKEAAVSAVKSELGLTDGENVNDLILGLDNTLYPGLSEDSVLSVLYTLVKEKFETKPDAPQTSGECNEFAAIYSKAVMISKLNSGITVDASEIIREFELNDLEELYNSLGNKGKQSFNSAILKKNFSGIEDMYSEMKDLVLINHINYPQNPSEVMDIISGYGDYLEIDMQGYNSASNRTKLISELIDNGPYSDRNALKNEFKRLTAKYRPQQQTGGGGGSGGKSGVISSAGTGISQSGNIYSDTIAPEKQPAFKDVSKDHWAYEAVSFLAEENILSGKGENVFDPASPVKREEFAKILCLAFDLEEGKEEKTFYDVDPGAWYYEYVKKAASCGAVNGTGENVFGTGGFLTRQDIAVILARSLGMEESADDYNDIFDDDGEISEYALNGVYTLKKMGILSGTGNNLFEPKRSVTRAECAKIVYELIKKEKEV